ncbi:hypothetical protein [Paenibacillus turpanensis]|uniref:hypothetical protein n=1 Tax=Paenibacillus turpanensis TaxID=2689078 RepID=UPI0014092CEC|nr:hypothetical protein [Paenibacillus turpanensis]
MSVQVIEGNLAVKSPTIRKSLISARGKSISFNPLTCDNLNERLRFKYSEKKIDFIWRVEDAYNEAQESRNGYELYQLLKDEIKRKALFYEGKYSGYRISRHDFESAFIQELVRLASSPLTNPEYFFYETLSKAFRLRAIDVVRRETGQRSKQRQFENEAIRLDAVNPKEVATAGNEVEERVTSRVLVEEILNCGDLNELERDLLYTMKDNPDASLRELGDSIGVNHPQKVKRLLDGIREKLNDYNPFSSVGYTDVSSVNVGVR